MESLGVPRSMWSLAKVSGRVIEDIGYAGRLVDLLGRHLLQCLQTNTQQHRLEMAVFSRPTPYALSYPK